MRDGWNEYFLKIAYQVATRATCDRLHVGCVIVDPNTRSILSSGYNGSVRGADHCDDVGHDMVNNHCVRTVHAEANAIAQAAANGAKVKGAWAYLTAYPCWPCARLLLNAGISKMFFAKAYRIDERVEAAAGRLGVTIEEVQVIDPTRTAAEHEAVMAIEIRMRGIAENTKREALTMLGAMELERDLQWRNADRWRSMYLDARRRIERLDPGLAASSEADGRPQDAPTEAREE